MVGRFDRDKTEETTGVTGLKYSNQRAGVFDR